MDRQESNFHAVIQTDAERKCDFLEAGEDPRTWKTHPLTGGFIDRAQEEGYLRASFHDRLHLYTILAVPAAVFFVLGVLVDVLIMGPSHEEIPLILLIRCLGAGVVLGTVWFAGKFREYARVFDWLMLMALVVVGGVVCVLTGVVGGSVFLHAQTGLILLIIFYVFVPIRMIFALAVGVGFSLCFLLSLITNLQLSDEGLFQVVFYVVMINLLGSIFAREQQKARRREYAGHLSECRIAEALRREMATREAMERTIAEKEMRFRSLVELAPDAILVHRHGRILYVNPQAVSLAGGKDASDVIGRSLFDYIVSDNLGAIASRIQRLEEGGGPLAPLEIQTRTIDGKIIDCEIVSGSVLFSGEPAIQSVVRDVTERKMMSRELMRLATTDALTGIFNRRKFFEELEREWSRARRHSHPLSLIMFDVDFFKAVNDTYGHAVGDEVLRCMVRETGGLLRSEDIFCRLGGEEFGILLPEINLEGARALAERIRKALEEMSIESLEGVVRCTVSLGVASARLAQESIDRALKRADDALYEAKRTGRNRVEVA